MKKISITIVVVFCLAVLAFIFSRGGQLPARGLVAGENEIFNGNSEDQQLEVYFFDVGQGDSAMIKKGDWEMLIDGGPGDLVLEKIGECLPFTDRNIEVVVLSHAHADHVDGLAKVLERYDVGQVYFNGSVHTAPGYLQFLKLIKDKNIPATIIDKPQELSFIDNLKLEIFAPQHSFYQVRPKDINNSSLVFKLVHGSSSALFMGDFEDEESLLLLSSIQLKSEILKVGHHGSTNANDRLFLRAVSPSFAVISAGKDNSFGHPHYRTLHYLKEIGSKIMRTDEDGDIKFISSGQGFRLSQP